MIKLKRKSVVFADTPLIEGLYVTRGGDMLQIRLKGEQTVMSSVSSFEELVKCGKLLVKRYKTVENLKRKVSECEYSGNISEQELIRRQFSENQAITSELQRKWYEAVSEEEIVETQVKTTKPKRVKLKLK